MTDLNWVSMSRVDIVCSWYSTVINKRNIVGKQIWNIKLLYYFINRLDKPLIL